MATRYGTVRQLALEAVARWLTGIAKPAGATSDDSRSDVRQLRRVPAASSPMRMKSIHPLRGTGTQT